MALYETYRYKVAYKNDSWKVLSDSGTVVASYGKKSSAKREGKRRAKNKARRTDKKIRLEIYKKSGQHQKTNKYN